MFLVCWFFVVLSIDYNILSPADVLAWAARRAAICSSSWGGEQGALVGQVERIELQGSEFGELHRWVGRWYLSWFHCCRFSKRGITLLRARRTPA